MGNPELTVVSYAFSLPDGAAAPSTAAALVPAGVPDATDQTVGQIPMPAAGYIYGLSAECGAASGDTVVVSVTVGGTIQASTTITCTNAAPRQQILLATPISFASGAGLGVKYTTTTGGTYTANDLSAQVLVGLQITTQAMGLV